MPISAQRYRKSTGQYIYKQSLRSRVKVSLRPSSEKIDPALSLEMATEKFVVSKRAMPSFMLSKMRGSSRNPMFLFFMLLLLVSQAMGQTLPLELKLDALEEERGRPVGEKDSIVVKEYDTTVPALPSASESFTDAAAVISIPVMEPLGLFPREIAFDQVYLMSLVDIRYGQGNMGICHGLCNLFSMLDPKEIEAFINDNKVERLESDVLFSYAIAKQSHGLIYKPSNNVYGEYKLKLRNHITLLAKTPADLFQELWANSRNKSVLKKAGTGSKFFVKLADSLKEGVIYRLCTVRHAMLIQKHEGKIKFFDPNRGFLFFTNAEELYSKIKYLEQFDSEMHLFLWEFDGINTYEAMQATLSTLAEDKQIDLLAQSIEFSDFHTVCAILDKHPEYIQISLRGTPLLIKAVLGKVDPSIISYMLKIPKTDVNVADLNGSTALFVASQEGQVDVVHILLKHARIDINKAALQGCTALFIAAQNKHIEVMIALLERAEIDINKVNLMGATPLYTAVQNGWADGVVMLLKHRNIDVNKASPAGFSPLCVAAEAGSVKVIQALLKHPGIDVNKADVKGHTSLYLAVQKGHIKAAKALLKHPEIDVNKANLVGIAPLLLAAVKGDVEMVRSLLQSGANPSSVPKDYKAADPIIEAMLNQARKEWPSREKPFYKHKQTESMRIDAEGEPHPGS
ncbi:MAG: ankyrin repeat domain-containing protein [Gammaproteobacteria bacterium]|nr:ankyrin repeat domain-containing protein [Gammaproteobacteria bacterium]